MYYTGLFIDWSNFWKKAFPKTQGAFLVKVVNATFLNGFGVLNTNIYVTKPKFEFLTL